MADPVAITSKPSLPKLQTRLRQIEAALTEVTELTNDGTRTIAMIVDVDEVPKPIRLELDPAGTSQPQAGEKLVCRGEVIILTFKQKVAAFRPNS